MHRVNLIVGLSESYTTPRHVGSVVIRGTRGILRAKVLRGERGSVVASTTSELHVRRLEGAKVKTLAGFREETRALLVLTTAGGLEFLRTPQKFSSDGS
jgi:hypothetical protein